MQLCAMLDYGEDMRRVTGLGRTEQYHAVGREELPPPITVGARRKKFMADEVATVMAVRRAGASHDQVRKLVRALVAKRAEQAAPVLATLVGQAA